MYTPREAEIALWTDRPPATAKVVKWDDMMDLETMGFGCVGGMV
jgi:hypothetical protein